MPGEEKEKTRKRRKPRNPDIPAWVLDKLEVPKCDQLKTVESRWMFEAQETFLIVARTENQAVRRETIEFDLLSQHSTLLAELIAWMNFALSTIADIEDIKKILAEVEAYLVRQSYLNAEFRFEDFVFFESQLISHRYPNEYNPDYMDIFFNDSTSGIIFSSVLSIPSLLTLYKSNVYRHMSLEQKKQILNQIVDLYYWFRYRLHTICAQLFKKQIQIGNKSKNDTLTFTFFDAQETSRFGYVSSDLVFTDLQRYFQQLEEKITALLRSFGRNTQFSSQIKTRLIGQVCFDLRQGLQLLSEQKYDLALACQHHLSDKEERFFTSINFSFVHDNSDLWIAPNQSDDPEENLRVRLFMDKSLKKGPTDHFLCLTQESIPVLQKFGRCPNREKTTRIVVCPHRHQS